MLVNSGSKAPWSRNGKQKIQKPLGYYDAWVSGYIRLPRPLPNAQFSVPHISTQHDTRYQSTLSIQHTSYHENLTHHPHTCHRDDAHSRGSSLVRNLPVRLRRRRHGLLRGRRRYLGRGATLGATAPATIVACNTAFGTCSATCWTVTGLNPLLP